MRELELLDADLVGVDPMDLVRALPGVLRETGAALDPKRAAAQAAAAAPPPPPAPAEEPLDWKWKAGGAAAALLLLLGLVRR